ncbi:MAG: NifB/NifX family molybdenum-iron cluster-binding protein [Desulforhopalus sp.]
MSVISLAEHKDSCCSEKTNKSGRVIHLPVAPQVVARTRFSPPPPARSLSIMVPEALEYLDAVMMEKEGNISMAAITGPGDPLATPDITINTVQRIRERYPQLKIGLKTMGIGSEKLAGDLALAGVDYLEIQVDGVRSAILEKIYAWIRPGLKTLKISDAVSLLLKEQRNGIPALKFHNITVSILTTLYPGYNIDHVPKIAVELMELGADSIALIPYKPEPGVEVDLESPGCQILRETADKVRKHLPIVEPVLVQSSEDSDKGPISGATLTPQPTKERPNVAIVSSNGIDIDLHLGQAIRFLIYGPREDGLTCLLEARNAPAPGTGKNRWQQVAAILKDCFILLAASAGETPRRELAETGLKVSISEDNIEGIVDVLYGGGKKCNKDKK